jgi:sugar O-acyltransferase (sialic acid O-acetyltransferase NeuD family)
VSRRIWRLPLLEGDIVKIYGLFGAGGFAREVMPVAKAMLAELDPQEHLLVYVVDGDAPTKSVNGDPVWATERFLREPGEKRFNVAIASAEARRRIAERCVVAGIDSFEIRAPNSWITPGNVIGEGAVFCPFTTVTASASIGRFFHANIYSYVAHDCVIGDFVTFAPAVCCNGGTVVEDHAYIGTGAIIREARAGVPIVIGEGAVVGMGAVVTRDVAPHTTVVGNPARPLKKL